MRYLLGKARNTAWGKRYAFAEISGYDTFRERVPLQDYENLHPFIERMINGEKDVLWPSTVRWYAQSSGTTNDRSKYIPVTPDILRLFTNSHHIYMVSCQNFQILIKFFD